MRDTKIREVSNVEDLPAPATECAGYACLDFDVECEESKFGGGKEEVTDETSVVHFHSRK